jgi:hypothetical protein
MLQQPGGQAGQALLVGLCGGLQALLGCAYGLEGSCPDTCLTVLAVGGTMAWR